MPKIETKEIALIRRDADGLVVTAQNLDVLDEESAGNANELLVFVADARKKLEKQRVFLVKPLNDHVKDINTVFKEWAKPLDDADSVVRRKVLDFQREQEALRQEYLREQERLAELPEGLLDDLLEEDIPDLPVVTRTIEGSKGSTSMRKTWAYEVMDETLVPREYLMVDEGLIRLAVHDGTRKIPGVRIYQQESLSVRTK